MSDLACWRQGEHVVVRIRGNEHLMEWIEAYELAQHIDNVVHYGKAESLGEDYADLRQRRKPLEPSLLAGLKAALGIQTRSLRR